MSRKLTFTREQQAVIEHQGSHALVSAVAGAGKTTTMVERIARLVQNGEPSDRIIALVYNKSAQESLAARLRDRLPGIKAPQARTFHSIGLAMMKRLIEIGALKPAELEGSEAVLDRYRRQALRSAWKQIHGKDAFPSKEQLEGFAQFVTKAKADIRSPQEVFREGDFTIDCSPFVPALAEMDRAASRAKICFYDDLLCKTYNALAADPELWDHFQGKINYIIADEFQDVNPVQYALIQGIAGERAEVMVVGDCDQSIYGFRGASVDFITKHFAEDFSPCTILRLTNTFRYGHQTALIANHIISRNLERDDKITVATPSNADTRVTRIPMRPKQPTGLVPQLLPAKERKELRQNAVLVRYYSQSVPYEIELAEAEIPFHVYGREPMLLIPEIASLVGALCLAADYWVIPEILRPRFLGAMLKSPTIFAPSNILERAAKVMGDCVDAGGSAASALFELAATVEDERLKARLKKRADVLRLLEAGGLRNMSPAKIIASYLTFTDFKTNMAAGAATQSQVSEIEQNVSAFTDLASRYPLTTDLLDMLGPLAAHRSDKPPPHDHVPILSMHRAKGLEWDTVFLPAWTAGTFPREHEPIEEERRLAYVAITRAIKHLVFLHPYDEVIDDQERSLDTAPPAGKKVSLSPFLYDAETGLCAAAAESIRSGNGRKIRARRADVLNRYAQEAGIAGLHAEVPPELQQLQRQTYANPNLVLTEGQRVRTPDGDHYQVASKVGDRFYYVLPLLGGDPRLMCLDEPGWFFEPA